MTAAATGPIRALALGLILWGLSACPEPIPAPPDAGVSPAPDASTQRPDAQEPLDASTTQDADRSPDTGAPGQDAGLIADAGRALDASAPLDAAQAAPDAGAEPPGCGQFVRFTLHGTVTSVEAIDIDSVELWRRRLVNEPVRVVITYDATVADSRQQGDYGQYRQPSETTNMAITLESIRETYSQPETFFVEPFNNFQTQGDRLKFVGNYQLQLGIIAQAVVDFHDASATALDSVALPDTVPALADYPQGATLTITRSTLGDPEAEQERLLACQRLREGAVCRYGGEVGQCRLARRGLICTSLNAWPDRATVRARIDRVEDQCAP